MRRWSAFLAPAALVVALSAVAAPVAAAGAPVYGAALGPSPLIVEDWTSPTLYLANTGRVPIDATLSIDGAGYRLGSPATFRGIAPGQQVEVPVAAVGTGSALATAIVSASGVSATDTAVLRINVHARHLTLLDEAARSLPTLVLGGAALLGLAFLGLAALARRLRRRRSAA